MAARYTVEKIGRDQIAVEVVERHYSVEQVMELLSVSHTWVYDRINDGTFTPVVELGTGRSKQRIPASVLQAYLDARTFSAA